MTQSMRKSAVSWVANPTGFDYRIPRNDRRIFLLIPAIALTDFQFVPNVGTVPGGVSINCSGTTNGLEFSEAVHGDLCRCGGFVSANGSQGGYIEVILDPCECLDKPDPNPWK